MIINLAQRLLAKQRIESGYYDQPHVIERVMDRLMEELDDSADQTALNESANDWSDR